MGQEQLHKQPSTQPLKKARPVKATVNKDILGGAQTLLSQSLVRRQHAIQRIFKRSVPNKIYIFPRTGPSMQDVSLSPNESVEEMRGVQTYRLGSQNQWSRNAMKTLPQYPSEIIGRQMSKDIRRDIDNKDTLTHSHYRSDIKLIHQDSRREQKHSRAVLSARTKCHKLMSNISVGKKEVPYCKPVFKVALTLNRHQKQKQSPSSSALKHPAFTYITTRRQPNSQDCKSHKRFPNDTSHRLPASKIVQNYRSFQEKMTYRSRTEH